MNKNVIEEIENIPGGAEAVLAFYKKHNTFKTPSAFSNKELNKAMSIIETHLFNKLSKKKQLPHYPYVRNSLPRPSETVSQVFDVEDFLDISVKELLLKIREIRRNYGEKAIVNSYSRDSFYVEYKNKNYAQELEKYNKNNKIYLEEIKIYNNAIIVWNNYLDSDQFNIDIDSEVNQLLNQYSIKVSKSENALLCCHPQAKKHIVREINKYASLIFVCNQILNNESSVARVLVRKLTVKPLEPYY